MGIFQPGTLNPEPLNLGSKNTSAASHMQINFLCQGYRTYDGAAAWGETHHFALSYLVMIRLMQNGMSTLQNAATGIHGTSILGLLF